MRDILRLLQGKDFGSLEQMNKYLATLTGGGLQEALVDALPPTPKEEAQELAWQAMEAASEAQARKLARRALAKDADCVDAILVLTGLDANSPKQAIEGLQKAVAAGERSLGAAFFRENKGHFWGLLETRPYMRARQELADVMRDVGLLQDAIAHFKAMLELNPNDNQGVRDPLLGLYLQTGNLDGAGRLLKRYERDGSATFAWGRVLERVLARDLESASRLLKSARKENRFVELYMTAQRPFPAEMPESYTMGSAEEALISLESLAPAWTAHPEAMMWLLDQMLGRQAPAPPKRRSRKKPSVQ
jgi:tetratricopeptide (TPR) repeat protein